MKRAPLFGLVALVFASACSTPTSVPRQLQYAKLQNSRVYDADFPTVWKAIEDVFREYKINDRDPSNVDELEMKKLTKRTLETDWIFSKSRDKYRETRINNIPKRVPLQVRMKYTITAETRIGGTEVRVLQDEQLERLNDNGTTDGYDSVSEKERDSSRSNEILEKIGLAILSAHP